MENNKVKAWHYLQSSTLPGFWGEMIPIGKTFDTRENVEKALNGNLLRISVVVEGLDGGCLFTVTDKRRK